MKKILYYAAVLAALCVMAYSGFQIYEHFAKDAKYTGEFDKLAQLAAEVKRPVQSAAEPGEEGGDTGEEADEVSFPPDYSALYVQNNDMVGWITIEGTVIDYPVMQTPAEPDYYLKRDFYGAASEYGVPYVSAACDVFAPSDNVILYGHHIKNGKMFGALDGYKSQEFWAAHKWVEFNTLNEWGAYEVFAVFRTTADEDGLAYYDFINAADGDAFNAFVAECKALALYDTGITPVYGDKLLTLSTCEYSSANGRLVVMARRSAEPLPE